MTMQTCNEEHAAEAMRLCQQRLLDKVHQSLTTLSIRGHEELCIEAHAITECLCTFGMTRGTRSAIGAEARRAFDDEVKPNLGKALAGA